MTGARGEVVALIPARGGSQGVPRKNLRRVGGVPLLGRAIGSALAASHIDRVVVSTDDPEIAAVAREWGAEIVDRPAAISGSTASSESALLHGLDVLGVDRGVLVFIQATSPFIDPVDLDAAVQRVIDGDADSLFSAVESWGFIWRDGVDGAVGVNHDLRVRPRRQDREMEYLETGAFYVMDVEGFRRAEHRFFGRVGIAVVPEHSAIEIDTEQQLAISSALAPLVSPAAPLDVEAIVTDFDGVHTDDHAYVDQDGHEFVAVSREDGMGVSLLRRAGVPLLILSTETNPVVRARAAKLGVDVIQGLDDKGAALAAWAARTGIDLERVAYLGNDVNDLGCFDLVGWPVAVPDAHPRVLASARIVLSRPGGDGAVRELAERVLRSLESRRKVS
ncbi:cytidylyltransferase domain-containing protein [Pseudolysinimonas sp.]|uniref:cytidylyltransferase domain-containing protein n=1 Tax=Pseudolysinimonas sp. TaxID=2680009 RepID=UPI003F7D3FED